jgi:hypothetical protein
MSSNRSNASPLNSSAVAERLLAHARLCEQIAQDCWSEQTAEELRNMARECSRAAAEMTPERGTRPVMAH